MSEGRISSKFLVGAPSKLNIEFLDVFCLDGKIIDIRNNEKKDDIGDGVVIPAFFNIHSHLGENIFRNIKGDGWTITKYLKYTEEYNAGLLQEQKNKLWLESARDAAQEMYLQGTVGFCAARSSGIAVEYDLLTMSGYPIMNSQKLVDYKKAGVKGFIAYLDANKSDSNRIGVFLHSVYANDTESYIMARKCMDIGAEFITVHVSEDEETTKLERQAHNMSAVELLDKYGLLSERTILIHCGCCSEEDLLRIKEKGAIIGVCPISNNFLNTKMIDLYKLEDLGIPWCLATDGLGTGRSFSLLDQARCARDEYLKIPLEKFWTSITSVPGRVFGSDLYTGNVEIGVKSTFLKTEYNGTDVNELIEGLIEGKIGFKPIKV